MSEQDPEGRVIRLPDPFLHRAQTPLRALRIIQAQPVQTQRAALAGDRHRARRQHPDRLQRFRADGIQFPLGVPEGRVNPQRRIHRLEEPVQLRPFAFEGRGRDGLQEIAGVEDQVRLQRRRLLENSAHVLRHLTGLDIRQVQHLDRSGQLRRLQPHPPDHQPFRLHPRHVVAQRPQIRRQKQHQTRQRQGTLPDHRTRHPHQGEERRHPRQRPRKFDQVEPIGVVNRRKIGIQHSPRIVDPIAQHHISQQHDRRRQARTDEKPAPLARSMVGHAELFEFAHFSGCLLTNSRIAKGTSATAPKPQHSNNSTGARKPERFAF